jgi:hypothetical protein
VVRSLAFYLYKVAAPNLVENFLNATRNQSSCEENKNKRSAECGGFSLRTPVSSHRESRQGGLADRRAHNNWLILLWRHILFI